MTTAPLPGTGGRWDEDPAAMQVTGEIADGYIPSLDPLQIDDSSYTYLPEDEEGDEFASELDGEIDDEYGDEGVLGDDEDELDDWMPSGGTDGGIDASGLTEEERRFLGLDSGDRRRASARPRRPTVTDARDRAGLLLIGKSYAGATPSERAAIDRALGQLDMAAMAAYGKGFRDLSADQQSALTGGVGFELDPMDDPAYRRQYSEARSDRLRAESIARAEKNRKELWERQDRLREEALARKKEEEMLDAVTKAPSPLRAPAAPRRPTLSWNLIRRLVPASTLSALIGAWASGGSGMTSVNPIALQRLMASLPIATTAAELLLQLRLIWAAQAPDATANPSDRRAAAAGGSGSTPSVIRQPRRRTSLR